MPARRVTMLAAAIILIVLLMVFMKVTMSARNEYELAEKALSQGNVEEAITHFNRALHWYSPGSTSVRNSVERLWEIGNKAEHAQNDATALNAYRMLRSGLYSARSFYTPYTDWIDKCDYRIATIIAQQPSRRSPSGNSYPVPLKKAVLESLKARTEPDYFWSIICEVGFIGWIACTIGFTFFVFTGEKRFQPKRALAWGIPIVVFYALWVVGMLRA